MIIKCTYANGNLGGLSQGGPCPLPVPCVGHRQEGKTSKKDY